MAILNCKGSWDMESFLCPNIAQLNNLKHERRRRINFGRTLMTAPFFHCNGWFLELPVEVPEVKWYMQSSTAVVKSMGPGVKLPDLECNIFSAIKGKY